MIQTHSSSRKGGLRPEPGIAMSRANVWHTIERFEAGEVSPREAHEVLRQEKKALSAMGRRLSGLKRARVRK